VAPTALSDDQIRFFEQNGYVKGGRVLDPAQIDALRSGLEAIRTGENPRTGDLYEIDEDYRRAPTRTSSISSAPGSSTRPSTTCCSIQRSP
jgi:hypothetical protein